MWVRTCGFVLARHEHSRIQIRWNKKALCARGCVMTSIAYRKADSAGTEGHTPSCIDRIARNRTGHGHGRNNPSLVSTSYCRSVYFTAVSICHSCMSFSRLTAILHTLWWEHAHMQHPGRDIAHASLTARARALGIPTCDRHNGQHRQTPGQTSPWHLPGTVIKSDDT